MQKSYKIIRHLCIWGKQEMLNRMEPKSFIFGARIADFCVV